MFKYQSEPASALTVRDAAAKRKTNMEVKTKRKAASPCESLKKNLRVFSPNTSGNSEFFSPISEFESSCEKSNMSFNDEMDQEKVFIRRCLGTGSSCLNKRNRD